MIRGSCACGTVRFELAATPTMMATCHCSRCRKLGVSTFVFVRREDFTWVSGREAVAVLESEPPFEYRRCFCRRCGTGLGEVLTDAETFPVSANALDDDPQVRNRFHEFVADKPAWLEIGDDARQFEGPPMETSA